MFLTTGVTLKLTIHFGAGIEQFMKKGRKRMLTALDS
jgi:hypothetical protein